MKTSTSDASIPPRLASVPAFPPVVMRLISLLADEESSTASIAACIASDPTFAARVLKRANAADIGTYVPAADVPQALVRLGMQRTRELTLTIATVAYLGNALKTEQMRRCWAHNVACAMISAELARICALDPAEPYTAGLLHDLGRLGLVTAYPAEYEQTMAGADGDGARILEFERARFGVDHTEAGHWLAQHWELPESIVNVASHHHDVPSGSLDLLGIVQVACPLADVLGFSVSEAEAGPQYEEVTAWLPAPVRRRLASRLEHLESEIHRQIDVFGRPDLPKPVRRIEVAIQEEEERDFLNDFPAPQSQRCLPPAPPGRARPFVRVAVALAALALAVSAYLWWADLAARF